MNEIWVTAVSADDHGAASSALLLCERKAGAVCRFNIVCSGQSGTWAGLSRQFVDHTYTYRLVCDGTSPDQVLSAITCDGCEVLWEPQSVR